MRVYTVHVRTPIRDDNRDIVLVKEGFSWLACIFSSLWALVSRLWLVALGLIALDLCVGALLGLTALAPATQAVIALGVAILIGFVANDLKRWTLFRRGYAEVGVVAADGADAAAQRFFDRHPQLLSSVGR